MWVQVEALGNARDGPQVAEVSKLESKKVELGEHSRGVGKVRARSPIFMVREG